MSAAKTFDRATLQVFHPDGRTVLYQRVRVIGRVDNVVELYGESKHHPGGDPVPGHRKVVLVARFEDASIVHIGKAEWQLRIADDTYRMVRDSHCSTCSRSPLASVGL